MTIKEHLTDQFRQPRGPLGRLAGRIMATRGSNVQRNRRTPPGSRIGSNCTLATSPISVSDSRDHLTACSR